MVSPSDQHLHLLPTYPGDPEVSKSSFHPRPPPAAGFQIIWAKSPTVQRTGIIRTVTTCSLKILQNYQQTDIQNKTQLLASHRDQKALQTGLGMQFIHPHNPEWNATFLSVFSNSMQALGRYNEESNRNHGNASGRLNFLPWN